MQKKSIFFNQKGTTAVEFAIVLSLLITLIFGIIEFGLVMFNRQVITNAAREGARYGIIARAVRVHDDEIKQKVRDYAEEYLVTFGADVLTDDDIVIPARCTTFQCDLEVQVNYVYDFLFLSNIGIGPLNLRATSVMKME
jgi:Flp pilus assembly protein TadG